MMSCPIGIDWSVTHVGAAVRLDEVVRCRAVPRRLSRAFLEPRERFAAAIGVSPALRLGWICRAIDVQRWASALDPPHRDEHLDGVATG